MKNTIKWKYFLASFSFDFKCFNYMIINWFENFNSNVIKMFFWLNLNV